MNTKYLWIAVLSGAVLTTLVSNLPIIDLVNFLCFIGFWGCPSFAAWLYRRLSGSLTVGQALRMGTLTGLCAGMLGFALSFLGLAGIQGTVNELRQFLPPEDMQDLDNIPAWGAVIFNLVGVLFNIIFGAIGGLLGGVFFRTDQIAKN